MKTKRNELCPCGSGKKYKKCCIDIDRLQHNDQITSGHLEEECDISIFYGYTEEYMGLGPFELEYENSCCQVIQANKTIADEHNTILKFEMLAPGDWFVMARIDGEMKVSFKYKTPEEAMDIAKEKFGAVKFVTAPQFI